MSTDQNFGKQSTAYGRPVRKGLVNVASLYIRRTPAVEDNTLGILKQFDKVIIINDHVNNEFIKVRTENNIEGFVMKKFIRILT